MNQKFAQIETYEQLQKEYLKNMDINQLKNYHFKADLEQIEPLESLNFDDFENKNNFNFTENLLEKSCNPQNLRQRNEAEYEQFFPSNVNMPPYNNIKSNKELKAEEENLKGFGDKNEFFQGKNNEELINGLGPVRGRNLENLDIRQVDNKNKLNSSSSKSNYPTQVTNANVVLTSIEKERELEKEIAKKKQIELQNYLQKQIKEKNEKKRLEKERRIKEDLMYEEKFRREQEEFMEEQKRRENKVNNNQYFHTNYPQHPNAHSSPSKFQKLPKKPTLNQQEDELFQRKLAVSNSSNNIKSDKNLHRIRSGTDLNSMKEAETTDFLQQQILRQNLMNQGIADGGVNFNLQPPSIENLVSASQANNGYKTHTNY